MLTDERAGPAPSTAVGQSVQAVTAPPGPSPESGDRGRRPLLAWIALVVLFAGFELDQLRALLGYGRIATNEDQTLLWFAGRELLGFHLHQPNFYGQNYNTVFEAVPGQLFHLLGVSLSLASPLGTMLIAAACWLVLAWVALRRGHQLAAAAALALPVCLSVPYLLLFDAPRGVMSGDLAGVLAVAAALTIRRPRWRLAVLLAVGGLAIAWENAVALAVLPALAATTVGSMRGLLARPWRTLLVAGGALLIPAGWLVLDHLWYRGHAVDLTAANVNTKLQLSVLATNLEHPARLFGFYAPQLWQRPVVVIAAIGALLLLAVAVSFTVRRSAPAAAALTFLVVLLGILSARDTLDVHPDLYLSGSRFLLPMPIGLWVVLFFTLAAIRDHRRGSGPRTPAPGSPHPAGRDHRAGLGKHGLRPDAVRRGAAQGDGRRCGDPSGPGGRRFQGAARRVRRGHAGLSQHPSPAARDLPAQRRLRVRRSGRPEHARHRLRAPRLATSGGHDPSGEPDPDSGLDVPHAGGSHGRLPARGSRHSAAHDTAPLAQRHPGRNRRRAAHPMRADRGLIAA